MTTAFSPYIFSGSRIPGRDALIRAALEKVLRGRHGLVVRGFYGEAQSRVCVSNEGMYSWIVVTMSDTRSLPNVAANFPQLLESLGLSGCVVAPTVIGSREVCYHPV